MINSSVVVAVSGQIIFKLDDNELYIHLGREKEIQKILNETLNKVGPQILSSNLPQAFLPTHQPQFARQGLSGYYFTDSSILCSGLYGNSIFCGPIN